MVRPGSGTAAIALLRLPNGGCGRTKIIVGASVASAMAIGVLVSMNNLWWVGMLMIVVGGGMGAFNPIAWGLVQEFTPRDNGGARPRPL